MNDVLSVPSAAASLGHRLRSGVVSGRRGE